MLEAIKRLKEEAEVGAYAIDQKGDLFIKTSLAEILIDRAVAIASEHHLRKVEEAYKLECKKFLGKPNIPMLSASRQAHEELTGEVKTE